MIRNPQNSIGNFLSPYRWVLLGLYKSMRARQGFYKGSVGFYKSSIRVLSGKGLGSTCEGFFYLMFFWFSLGSFQDSLRDKGFGFRV